LQALFVMVLLLVVVVLLATEKLRADVVAMLSLALLMLARVLPPDAALSGFANPATVTVACMFVLSAGLQESGVMQYLGDRLLRDGPTSPGALLILTAIVVGPISAFINNTAAVAIFLPIALHACQGKGVSPSRILMGLSFFSMMGGMCTLIGTSTNILVSSVAAGHLDHLGQPIEPFRMFEFSRLGIVLFAAGTVYLLLLGHRVMPERVKPESLTQGFHLNRYLSEVVVLEGSTLAGKSLVEARLGERYDLEVLSLIRAGAIRGMPGENEILLEGDILLVKAPAAALVRLRDTAGIGIKPGRHPDDADLNSSESSLLEVVVSPNSVLEGRSLKGLDFRHRFGATVLAIRRHGADIREKIGRVRLRIGDELLLLAHRTNLERLKQQADFVVLQELEVPVLRPRAAATALLIVIGVIAVAAMNLYPIVEAAIIGAVLMVLTGCLHIRKVYPSVDWQVIFLLAGLIPMGVALETSGAAAQAVDLVLWLTGDLGHTAVLSAFFLLAALLTGFMSNAATAALLAPLAITTASSLGVSARPFLVALAFAASAAFYTPIGYQTNLLVYGPGGYRFKDFVRLGLPLTLLYWVLATFLIPVFFPF
jgi:di/tricarboxylate transporter